MVISLAPNAVNNAKAAMVIPGGSDAKQNPKVTQRFPRGYGKVLLTR